MARTKKKDEKMSELGKRGADIRWTNYRLTLINELRGLTTKEELDFYVNFSNSGLQEVIFNKRQKKHERS